VVLGQPITARRSRGGQGARGGWCQHRLDPPGGRLPGHRPGTAGLADPADEHVYPHGTLRAKLVEVAASVGWMSRWSAPG